MANLQAVGNDNGVGGAGTITVTLPSVSAGSCLNAFVGIFSKDVTGVQDSLGQTYTPGGALGADTESPGAWSFPNSAGSASPVVITATFSVSRASSMIVQEESGAAGSSPVAGFKIGAAAVTTTPTSGSGAVSTNSAIGFTVLVSSGSSNQSFASTDGSTALTGTGLTSGHHGNASGSDLYVARQVLGAAGNYAATGSCASAVVAALLYAIKAAVGGGGGGKQSKASIGIGIGL